MDESNVAVEAESVRHVKAVGVYALHRAHIVNVYRIGALILGKETRAAQLDARGESFALPVADTVVCGVVEFAVIDGDQRVSPIAEHFRKIRPYPERVAHFRNDGRREISVLYEVYRRQIVARVRFGKPVARISIQYALYHEIGIVLFELAARDVDDISAQCAERAFRNEIVIRRRRYLDHILQQDIPVTEVCSHVTRCARGRNCRGYIDRMLEHERIAVVHVHGIRRLRNDDIVLRNISVAARRRCDGFEPFFDVRHSAADDVYIFISSAADIRADYFSVHYRLYVRSALRVADIAADAV